MLLVLLLYYRIFYRACGGYCWCFRGIQREINLNSAETVLANGSASFPEVFLLICGPLEDVKQDIENRTFALPEMEKKKSREREYIEWSNVNVSTVNGDINYDEYFRLAD